MWKRKPLMVIGLDAKLMGDGNRLLPVFVSKASSFVLKLSKLDMFSGTFSDDEG
jgi:hypothetical protein